MLSLLKWELGRDSDFTELLGYLKEFIKFSNHVGPWIGDSKFTFSVCADESPIYFVLIYIKKPLLSKYCIIKFI